MKAPDTNIPCDVCWGSKINPAHKGQCGACFGSGLSTAPYHQRRNATTVTWKPDDPRLKKHGLIVHSSRLHQDRERHVMLISWPNPHYEEVCKRFGVEP